MGQKHSHNKKIRRNETLTNINNNHNIFDDAVDLEDEAEELKLGNKKSIFCPNCNKFFRTSNKNEIETWIKHKKSCNRNISNVNTFNSRSNIAPLPPPPININNNNIFTL